ncbi:SGNH/GDSL hydrolase family protein [Lunatibacter salilacus]|uniref:SGNH/GDSL hydrolase family protein n=1 Tax=Lunatibacter salilacus TaxID=2483804 RepID=UPI00131EBB51|nr:SGNH/GDSL hydrolase family protein [Lunatibacter salilacus]
MKKVLLVLRNILLVSLPTLLVLFLILELFFRFVIPASDQPGGYFYDDEKMYSFESSRESGYVTIGKFAEIKAKWRINNMNWNYSIDYYPVQDKKLISVIGDSYIEAFMVDVDKKYPYLLRNELYPEYEVFAFGKSGASLSQYLHLSRYVNKHLNPDILIFNMVHNDFEESIYELHPDRHYFLQLSYNESEDIFSETTPKPNYSTAQFTLWKRVLYKSAFFRYLYGNLNVSNLRQQIIAGGRDNEFEGNINPVQVKDKQDLIQKSTDYLVKTIIEENFEKRVIFVFDAPRFSIYNNTLENSKLWWMHDMMRKICQKYNAEYIDLTDPMKEDFVKNGRKFNSELDAHWDEYGHEFVANILIDYLSK